MNTTLNSIYKDYPVKPYISPNRDMEAWLLKTLSLFQNATWNYSKTIY